MSYLWIGFLLLNFSIAQAAEEDIAGFLAKMCSRAQESPFVTQPIPGLWDKIPTHGKNIVFKGPNGEHIEIRMGYNIDITVTLANGKRVSGFVTRTISKGHVQFLNAELPIEIPTWIQIPDIPDLVPGKGIPTQLFLNLLAFKQKAAFGNLIKFSETVGNKVTWFEITTSPNVARFIKQNPGKPIPGQLIVDYFLNTRTGRSLQLTAIQSGHRIKRVSILDDSVALAEEFVDPNFTLADMYKNKNIVPDSVLHLENKAYFPGSVAQNEIEEIKSQVFSFQKQLETIPQLKEIFTALGSLETNRDLVRWYYSLETLFNAAKYSLVGNVSQANLKSILATKEKIKKILTTLPVPSRQLISAFDIEIELEPFFPRLSSPP